MIILPISARIKYPLQDSLYDALQTGDLETFHKTLHALFSGIPYQNYANKIIERYEGYYASVIYAYLASLGLPFVAEDVSSKDRVDMSIILPQAVYVIEFKVDNAPGAALDQIKEKGYHRKYLADNRTVYIIGIGFDSKEKNITEFEWEKV